MREGIKLDKSKIQPNSGLKALSKLLLNSQQWGRYAMQTLKTVTNSSNTSTTNNMKSKIFFFKPSNQEIAMLLYQDNEEMQWSSNQTNVVVAAFVTSQARLKLYSEMKLLDERVLYVDTDSFFLQKTYKHLI